jgi:X-Pro dipeptidyl-peptidase
MSHGFNDWNVMPEQSFRFAQALKDRDVPVQYYYHQGGHGGPPPLELMNRWFTRYVMGVENGVEHDPKAWIVREGDDRLEPTPYPDFPNPESTGVPLYPAGDGNWTGTLSLTAGADGDAGGLVDNFSFDGASLAAAEWSSHRLLYATPELTDDVHLSGVTTVKIRVAADAPAANLSVWLVSLPWTDSETITDNVITRGWADPQNAGAEDITTPRAGQSLTPGEFVELEFDLMEHRAACGGRQRGSGAGHRPDQLRRQAASISGPGGERWREPLPKGCAGAWTLQPARLTVAFGS